LKREVGPFIVNNRKDLQVAESMLQGLNLEQGETWQYDPFGIISSKRQEFQLTSYEHHRKPQVEQIMNLYSWKDVQKILQGKIQNVSQVSQTVVIDTPQQQEKSFKRSFLEELQVVLESEDEHSRKKQRIEGNTEEISEEDIQVIEDTSEETQKKPAFTIEFLPSVVFDNIQNQEGAESSEIKPKNIFSEYEKMKDKNVEIKQILLPELDQDSSKSRLLSALYFEKGRFNLSLLEPNDQNLRSVDNYRATNFSVDLEQIHIVDKMDLLRQT
jgi:hypothetical protein